ncbi:hypothetical protein [Nesterenkonia sphaerica]|uniref:hypothetical protein n=1 Tax=Nesterenkonia sphaerica TaxID=1804988 RepID=UPI00140E3D8C|nr:hypothetical protein [Nesterenkonia sphaerica]
MYGSDQSQAATVAAPGALLGFGWQFIAFGVLLMAVLALLTIASILYYRSRADR